MQYLIIKIKQICVNLRRYLRLSASTSHRIFFVDSGKFVGSGRSKGFVLLFTILVSSIILLVALGISGISYRETILTSEANGGAEAFFAADTGAECGLYLAFTNINDATCLNVKKIVNEDNSISLTQTDNFNIDDKYCVIITQPTDNSIESRGYNVNCDNIDNPRAVQRAIKVTY